MKQITPSRIKDAQVPKSWIKEPASWLSNYRNLDRKIRLQCKEELHLTDGCISEVKSWVKNPTLRNQRNMRGQAKAEAIAKWMLENVDGKSRNFKVQQVDLQEEIDKLSPEQVTPSESKDLIHLIHSMLKQLHVKIDVQEALLYDIKDMLRAGSADGGPGKPIKGKKAKAKVKKNYAEAMGKAKKKKAKKKKSKKK